MRALFAATLAAAFASAGCSHFQPATHPLYSGPPRPLAEVSRLSGPVAIVDGVDVSRIGSSFTLLPGCHVVELRKKIGEGSVSGAWSTELRHAVYAFRMKAGASYEIDIRLEPGTNSVGNGTVGQVDVEAVERDPSGKVAGVIAPVRKPADVEACRAWEASLGPGNPDAATPALPAPDAGAHG